MIHELEFDAYHQTGGDRYFEDVIFVAEILVNGNDVSIQKIVPRSDMTAYLKTIKSKVNVEASVEYMKSNLQHSIDHLVEHAKKNERLFVDEMNEYAEETNEPGINVILEV